MDSIAGAVVDIRQTSLLHNDAVERDTQWTVYSNRARSLTRDLNNRQVTLANACRKGS